MKKQLIVIAAAVALVGCAENRGGVHYGGGRQSGTGTSSDQMSTTNHWDSSGAPGSSSGSSSSSSSTNANVSIGSGDSSTGTQTGNQTNDRLRP